MWEVGCRVWRHALRPLMSMILCGAISSVDLCQPLLLVHDLGWHHRSEVLMNGTTCGFGCLRYGDKR